MISLNNVFHHYGTRPVRRGITMHVGRGELVALMGPNGMGKTTALAVMAGVLWPVRGSVDINGKRRRESPQEELAIRKEVVYVPADASPVSGTARESILAMGRAYGVDDDRLLDHAERLLVLFDLAAKADESVYSLSTGQQKKVVLCAALAAETPVMLLDEPFSGGLDPSGILALKRVLRHRVERDGATVVVATPVPELVAELADRVAVLREGRVIAYDTVEGLRRLAGVTGDDTPLDEVYERLANPQALANIEQYFAAGGGGRRA
jgi:ABC-2 type transport system ATP-binding protein